MSGASDRQGRRIVLVDDEEALAWSLASRLAKVRPQHRVETANDGATALAKMNDTPMDLLVADIRMPGMSGIDLVLAARSAQPELPVILMTAFKSVDIQRLSSGPFTGFLEKPFEFDRLLELVDRALTPSPVGFSGAISVQTLPDIVQLYVLSSTTGVLAVEHGLDVGEIWFQQGSILHATTPSATGDEAVYEIMLWSGGSFSMRAGARAPSRSVRSNWQELLMESCRRLDERARGTSPTSRSGWTQSPPPMPPADDFVLGPDFEDHDLDERAQRARSNEQEERVQRAQRTQRTSSPEFEVRLKPTRSPAFEEEDPDTRKLVAPDAANIANNPLLKVTAEGTMNIKDSLAKLNGIDGFVGAALVDSESGMLLGQEGGGSVNLEVAAAGNTEVVRAKRKTMSNLGLKDQIDDILITLGRQYHLIRPLRSRSTLFFYVALDRQRANLAMARLTLADVEKELQV